MSNPNPSKLELISATVEMEEDYWLFENLKDVPYGRLPLANLTAKGGPTTIKSYERLTSYNWYLDDQFRPTIVFPGNPREFVFWNGGRLPVDRGVLVYDVNHLKMNHASLDPAILCVKMAAENAKKPQVDFQDFDFITDSVNLQKIFAFCKGEQEGLFRIDLERVGKTIIMNRVESSDLMEINYETFDNALKGTVCKSPSKRTTGPYYQIAQYQFGQLKMLVRFESDCADYTKLSDYKPSESIEKKDEPLPEPERIPFFDADDYPLCYIEHGKHNKNHTLMNVVSYPANRGFPLFTWAQLFFSGMDGIVVGYYKGANDFGRPAPHTLQDINRLMKPLPYAILSKVHDCLLKVVNFMMANDEELKIGLVWKGVEQLEIFEKANDSPGAISDHVKALLRMQTIPEPGS